MEMTKFCGLFYYSYYFSGMAIVAVVAIIVAVVIIMIVVATHLAQITAIQDAVVN